MAPETSDLEAFAEYIGLNGIDTDLFYESYYQIDNGEYEDQASESYAGNY